MPSCEHSRGCIKSGVVIYRNSCGQSPRARSAESPLSLVTFAENFPLVIERGVRLARVWQSRLRARPECILRPPPHHLRSFSEIQSAPTAIALMRRVYSEFITLELRQLVSAKYLNNPLQYKSICRLISQMMSRITRRRFERGAIYLTVSLPASPSRQTDR